MKQWLVRIFVFRQGAYYFLRATCISIHQRRENSKQRSITTKRPLNAHHLDSNIQHTVTKTPLIIVPSHYFHEVAFLYASQTGIEC